MRITKPGKAVFILKQDSGILTTEQVVLQIRQHDYEHDEQMLTKM